MSTEEITTIPPAVVAARVAAFIRANMARLNMESWTSVRHEAPVSALLVSLDGTGSWCGSTCCAAGWTAVVAAPAGSVLVPDPEMFAEFGGDWDVLEMIRFPDGTVRWIAEFAATALGLGAPDRVKSGRPPMWPLFESWRSAEAVLAELDRIAAGGS